MKIHSYKNLIVWEKSVDLACMVYNVTEKFPRSELYGMVSQMRRASVSIPSNIAEGRSRTSRKDFSRFLSIAHGSAAELETQLEISSRLEFCSENNERILKNLISEIKAMLGSMIRKLSPLP